MVTRILALGAAGYIGSELVGKLLETSDYEVTVLDNLMYSRTSLLRYISNPNFHFVKGDVRNKELLLPLMEKSDVILSLAALVGAPLCDKFPRDAWEIHRDVNQYIVKNKSKDQLLLNCNSNSGYGSTDGNSVITEKDPLNPISIYGQSKCAGEKAIVQADNHLVMRLATVFGPSSRMRTDLLVNNLVLRAMKDRVLIVYEGQFQRNYVHIQDVCSAIDFALENWDDCKNEVYNFGNDEINMSKLQLCQKIKEHLPVEIIEAQYTKDLDVRNYIISSQKFYDKGFKCQYNLDDGIKQLINVYNIIGDDFIVHSNY